MGYFHFLCRKLGTFSGTYLDFVVSERGAGGSVRQGARGVEVGLVSGSSYEIVFSAV